MKPCACTALYEGSEFRTPVLFWNLETAIKTSSLTEIPVGIPFADAAVEEKWFKCSQCDRVWRLVSPDYPFKGAWDQIDPTS